MNANVLWVSRHVMNALCKKDTRKVCHRNSSSVPVSQNVTGASCCDINMLDLPVIPAGTWYLPKRSLDIILWWNFDFFYSFFLKVTFGTWFGFTASPVFGEEEQITVFHGSSSTIRLTTLLCSSFVQVLSCSCSFSSFIYYTQLIYWLGTNKKDCRPAPPI